MDQHALPAYAELPVGDDLPPGSSWGVWSDHDVLGTLNLLTPERVVAAAHSIRTGRTFGLNLDLTLPDPPLFGRASFRHEVTDERRTWDAMLNKQADIKRSDNQIHPQAVACRVPPARIAPDGRTARARNAHDRR